MKGRNLEECFRWRGRCNWTSRGVTLVIESCWSQHPGLVIGGREVAAGSEGYRKMIEDAG